MQSTRRLLISSAAEEDNNINPRNNARRTKKKTVQPSVKDNENVALRQAIIPADDLRGLLQPIGPRPRPPCSGRHLERHGRPCSSNAGSSTQEVGGLNDMVDRSRWKRFGSVWTRSTSESNRSMRCWPNTASTDAVLETLLSHQKGSKFPHLPIGSGVSLPYRPRRVVGRRHRSGRPRHGRFGERRWGDARHDGTASAGHSAAVTR